MATNGYPSDVRPGTVPRPANEGSTSVRLPSRTTLALVVSSLAVAGCGGGGGGGDGGAGSSTEIPDVRDCLASALEGATIEDTEPGDDDPKVSSGVFATTNASTPPTDGGAAPEPTGDFVMALAAQVKADATVKTFKRDSEGLADVLDQGGAEKLEVESGTKGTYVWVVAGAKGAEGLDAARDCVKP